MNTKYLLDQLLRSGSEVLNPKSSTTNSYEKPRNDLSSIISDKGAPALVGGVLGLLLGSKSGRKMGGKVLTYGGLAVLGTLAYKAYQNYQKESANPKGQPNPQPLDSLPEAEADSHCRAILVALIAASKADGHIDERERQLIDQEMSRLTTDSSIRQWLDSELKKPLDPASVARYATSQSMASEMFLASLLAVDEQSFMEKTYLEELARQMNLPVELQSQLKQQVQEYKNRAER
jgi:uncharacterized membrane protein YebE (DUF533 family)